MFPIYLLMPSVADDVGTQFKTDLIEGARDRHDLRRPAHAVARVFDMKVSQLPAKRQIVVDSTHVMFRTTRVA